MMHRALLVSMALILVLLLFPLTALPENGPAAGQEALASEPVLEEAPQEETAAEAEPEAAASPSEPTETAEAPTAADTPGEQPETSSRLRVLLPDGTVEEMELEDYLWGVVAAEMPAAFEEEALKAQAVAARTYTCYQIQHPKEAHPEADICTDYTCCQAWISREDRLAKWAEADRETYAAKLTAAVEATAGQILTWEGEPALTVFHASSGGRTRSAQAVWGQEVPYLVSVDSPEGEDDAPNYYSVVTLEAAEFSQLFLAQYPEADLSGSCEGWFGAVTEDDSGAPASFTVGGVTVSAQTLRTLCGLRSATFEVECGADTVTFYVTGYGHGVGMSQYGANVLAKEGETYEAILAHYYPGTVLE